MTAEPLDPKKQQEQGLGVLRNGNWEFCPSRSWISHVVGPPCPGSSLTILSAFLGPSAPCQVPNASRPFSTHRVNMVLAPALLEELLPSWIIER